MSSKLWLSTVTSDYRIGLEQGLRVKYYGEDWGPAQHEVPPLSNNRLENMNKHTAGYSLERIDFPEAAAIFDEKCFKRVGDLFIIGCFFAVREKLADVLKCYNLGEGGLIPIPIYQEDLETSVMENFYILNFGARKNTFMPNKSNNIKYLAINRQTGIEIWRINSWAQNYDIILSNDALCGPDLWIEEKVSSTLFISDALATALREVKWTVDFSLTECRLVEAD